MRLVKRQLQIYLNPLVYTNHSKQRTITINILYNPAIKSDCMYVYYPSKQQSVCIFMN